MAQASSERLFIKSERGLKMFYCLRCLADTMPTPRELNKCMPIYIIVNCAEFIDTKNFTKQFFLFVVPTSQFFET